MSDRRYNDSWGMRYEGHRVLLSRDFWMSVGFVDSDFINRATWQAALRRGPVNGNKRLKVDETVELECHETSESLVELFQADEENPVDLTVDTTVETVTDEYMDIGTPTFPGMDYNELDLDIDGFYDDLFKDEGSDQKPTETESEVTVLDLKGVPGINLGEFVSDSSVGPFMSRPLKISWFRA